MPVNIVLIGFMGSGKTTVAQRLSQRLRRAIVEMDELVYQKTCTRNMHEVFALGGELLLRETEIAIAKEYGSRKNMIISTGGGVVLNKIILDYFKKTGGTVIFLHAQWEQILERLKGDEARPLYKDQVSAKKLYDFRLPLYLHYADAIINIENRSADDIASQIIAMTNQPGDPHGF